MPIPEIKVGLKLPFLEIEGTWKPDESEQKAAWEMYVELITRVSVAELRKDEGLLREALSSLYSLFESTRKILKTYGPVIAQPKGKKDGISFGYIAISVLNVGVRPILAKWHPMLQDYENHRPADVSALEHEHAWDRAPELRKVLADLQPLLTEYAHLLAKAAGVPSLIIQRPAETTK